MIRLPRQVAVDPPAPASGPRTVHPPCGFFGSPHWAITRYTGIGHTAVTDCPCPVVAKLNVQASTNASIPPTLAAHSADTRFIPPTERPSYPQTPLRSRSSRATPE